VAELLILRHAATDWNEAGLIQGRADRPLSPAGRLQAARWRIPGKDRFTRCLASPLQRTLETARLLGLQPEAEPRLIEMDWGEWEGRNLKKLRSQLGSAMAANEAAGLDFRPPRGESPRDVQERLRPLLAALRQPTVAVTHKGVLRAVYALATGWTMRDDAPDKLRPATAHLFEVGPERIVVARLNIPLTPGR
jgi:broad specificity phosphatase PhoE